MTSPMLPGKHGFRSLVPLPRGPFPAGAPLAAILCYPRWLLAEVCRTEATTTYSWSHRGDVHLLESQASQVALVGGIGVGAPAAAMLVEELGAHGVTTFVIVGMAGSLDPALEPASIVVCDRALRDDGVSRHYLPPGRFVEPSESLTTRLARCLEGAGHAAAIGATWTTDAPYRETLEEVRQYRADGIRTVEMEAAAVFAVAAARGYQAAAAFVISDVLLDDGWVGHFGASDLKPRLRHVLRAARQSVVAE